MRRLGSLQIAHGAAAPALIAATVGLGITVALMVAAIAVGVAAPFFFSARGACSRPSPSRTVTVEFGLAHGLN